MRRILLLLPLLFVAGCGGDDTDGMTDEQQVRAVAEKFYDAMADGDANGGCDTLSAAADDRAVEESGYDSCEDGVQDSVEMVPEEQLEAMLKLEVREPRVRGATATVEVGFQGRTAPDPLELVKEDGEWKVDGGMGLGG